MLIGIFGGSFNPVHNGHIAIARRALEAARLDEVWFMVSPHNPFKRHDELLDDRLRLEMTRKALEGEPRLVCSGYEFRLPRPSYTWSTLQALSEDRPQDTFSLIIGADNWAAFPRWRNHAEILANYNIIVYPRKGYAMDVAALPERVTYIDMELYDTSSTEIRRLLSRGGDISRLTPPCVAAALEAQRKNIQTTI